MGTMRSSTGSMLRWGSRSAVALALLAATAVSDARPRHHRAHRHRHACRDLAHEVLGAADGWASLEPGTTGGVLAAPEQVYVVRTRLELLAALNDGVVPPPPAPAPAPPVVPSNAPKIIFVEGTIDFNVDDADVGLSCADYYTNGYTPEAFAAAFDPAVWGRGAPVGPQEDARNASRLVQQARIRMRVGSNTTLVGVGDDATLRGVWLDIRGTAAENVTNVIVRNVTFEDTFDCFTAWSPTDGALGSWNAEYDSVSLRNANHVWIDHNTFRDRETLDALQPTAFGVPYQIHDGALDITNASDLVTVSYNRFVDHDKVMIIGSSDGAVADRGKLRVTLHHNLFRNTGQRTPRVRFGQVHVYNNHYDQVGYAAYRYSWGVGVESAIIAENNFFSVDESVTPSRFISRFNGTLLFEAGTLVNGFRPANAVDVVLAYNDANDPDLSEEVGWVPALSAGLEPTWKVPGTVRRESGPFDW